jgi:hypothetical protein
MLKKLFVIVLLVGLLIPAGKVWAADNSGTNTCGWTNIKFAEYLAKQYGIQPIEGTTRERYEALVNALSQKGINSFANTKANQPVSCCLAAETLYAVTGTTAGAADSCDLKINYLVQNGIIKLPATAEGACDVLCDIEDTFAGIEKFSPPRLGPPKTNPPDWHPDNPSSRI